MLRFLSSPHQKMPTGDRAGRFPYQGTSAAQKLSRAAELEDPNTAVID